LRATIDLVMSMVLWERGRWNTQLLYKTLQEVRLRRVLPDLLVLYRIRLLVLSRVCLVTQRCLISDDLGVAEMSKLNCSTLKTNRLSYHVQRQWEQRVYE